MYMSVYLINMWLDIARSFDKSFYENFVSNRIIEFHFLHDFDFDLQFSNVEISDFRPDSKTEGNIIMVKQPEYVHFFKDQDLPVDL